MVPVVSWVNPERTVTACVWAQGVWGHSKDDVRQAVKELKLQVSRSEEGWKR